MNVMQNKHRGGVKKPRKNDIKQNLNFQVVEANPERIINQKILK
jgi:hypothetical protein